MILDNEMTVCSSVDMSVTDPDYSPLSIDLTLSPDLGSGEQLVAIINVESYTAGSATGCTFDIITSSAADLETSPKVIGSLLVSSTELEARDSGAYKAPVVVRINPGHEGSTPPGGVTERYVGIRFNHAGALATDMTVTAYFTLGYPSDPALSHHTSGFIIA